MSQPFRHFESSFIFKINFMSKGAGAAAGVYGLAFLGAVMYFIQHATSFWQGVLGVLEAIIWPAMLVYKLLEFLRM